MGVPKSNFDLLLNGLYEIGTFAILELQCQYGNWYLTKDRIADAYYLGL